VSFDLLFYSLLILFHQETEVIFARLLSNNNPAANQKSLTMNLKSPLISRPMTNNVGVNRRRNINRVRSFMILPSV
jgi:hypothetical protein